MSTACVALETLGKTMTDHEGAERRHHPRVPGTFIVSYRLLSEADRFGLSQTQNLSEGGMFLTTNAYFEPGTLLAMFLRLPSIDDPVNAVGTVVACKEVVADFFYETRIQFIDLDDATRESLDKTVRTVLEDKREDTTQPVGDDPKATK